MKIKTPTYDSYVTEFDIARRIMYRKQIWHHGMPDVVVEGENGSFGKLTFDFKDEKIEYNIYIKDKDRLLDDAIMSLENFQLWANYMYANGLY